MRFSNSERLYALETRKVELAREIVEAPPPAPRLHPNLAEVYRRKVAHLTEALNAYGTRAEAAEAIRGLINEVKMVPDGDRLEIELRGDLAMMLRAGLDSEKPGSSGAGLQQVMLVAGARNCLNLLLTASGIPAMAG